MFYDKFVKLCNTVEKAPCAVADEIGIQKSTVTRWKKGRTPTDATAQKIADYFGIPLSELVPNPWVNSNGRKLLSIVRLEESSVTPEQDKEILDFIGYVLSKNKKE